MAAKDLVAGDQELRQVLRHPQVHDLQLSSEVAQNVYLSRSLWTYSMVAYKCKVMVSLENWYLSVKFDLKEVVLKQWRMWSLPDLS